jgi:hypothetical protein
LKLPNNEIGISDILAYRACAQQFAFGMRRWTPLPERFQIFPGERDEPHEAESYATAYGSCVHLAIQIVDETDCIDDDAIEQAWAKYQHWLEPDDLPRLFSDLATWHERRVEGFRLVGAELEFRIPLFKWEGEWIYFRGKIDAVYQHLVNSGYFFTRDYKSSRWPKSEAEVHADIQQWAYNFAVHEEFPECETLIQIYDQLRFGEIPTRKSAKQRETIKAWLILQIKAILRDEILKPTMNDMCHFCPLVTDCRVTHRATDYWKNRIAALAPEKKVGRKIVVQLTEGIGFEEYTEVLGKVKTVSKMFERYIKAVEGALKEMPKEEREALGYELGNPRKLDEWSADAKRRIFAELGDDFFQVVRITKTDLASFFGEGTDQYERIVSMATKKETAQILREIKAA